MGSTAVEFVANLMVHCVVAARFSLLCQQAIGDASSYMLRVILFRTKPDLLTLNSYRWDKNRLPFLLIHACSLHEQLQVFALRCSIAQESILRLGRHYLPNCASSTTLAHWHILSVGSLLCHHSSSAGAFLEKATRRPYSMSLPGVAAYSQHNQYTGGGWKVAPRAWRRATCTGRRRSAARAVLYGS